MDDNESLPLQLPSDIEFVSEIMRLLVARWLEASTDPNGRMGLKKRGPKRKVITDGIGKQTYSKKSPKRGSYVKKQKKK